MGRIAWELMAVIAPQNTSNSTPGYRSRKRISAYLPAPKLGSGSPSAADSPNQNIRNVFVDFSAGIRNGVGVRAISAGKNRNPNFSLGMKKSCPWILARRRKSVGYPNPARLNTSSQPVRNRSGTIVAAANRNNQSL